MRLASIMLSAILLSCLSIQAHAVDAGVIAEPSMNVPNMGMPDPTPKPLVKLDNPDQALKQTDNMSPNQTQVAQMQQEGGPMDVSGKWSIKFNDKTGSSLTLTLWSSGGAKIMGYGTLIEDGAESSLTARGSVTEKELTLTAMLAAPENANQKFDECYLDLFMLNNTLSGTYVLSGGLSSGKGNATAVKL